MQKSGLRLGITGVDYFNVEADVDMATTLAKKMHITSTNNSDCFTAVAAVNVDRPFFLRTRQGQ